MTVDYSKIRSATARQLASASKRTAFGCGDKKEVTAIITIPTGVA
jgi:hypothetical protein